ncbi:MAG: tripartite tricarboxylate transporter TctB family protein [Spirochaetales bacterium]|nr:tripartite tricarboxylate transporter TctB family protein [Spirochaetales bacterium]
MELIKFFGKGAGLWIITAVMAVIFLVSLFIIIRSSKRKFAGRILLPLFFMEAALIFGIMVLGFPDKGDVVGPGVVPALWLFGIFGLSTFLFIRGLLGHEQEDPGWGHTGKVAIIIGMTIFYIYIMQIIGYSLATVIYIIGSMYFLSYRRWRVMITLSAGWILFSYFAFYRLLYVPLPRGRLIEWIFG